MLSASPRARSAATLATSIFLLILAIIVCFTGFTVVERRATLAYCTDFVASRVIEGTNTRYDLNKLREIQAEFGKLELVDVNGYIRICMMKHGFEMTGQQRSQSELASMPRLISTEPSSAASSYEDLAPGSPQPTLGLFE